MSFVGRPIRVGDCVRLSDGRTGRVRATLKNAIRVRVRRPTGATDQFLTVRATTLRPVDCPKGWMTPSGYARYLRVTLRKMRTRLKAGRLRAGRPRGGRPTPSVLFAEITAGTVLYRPDVHLALICAAAPMGVPTQ